MKYGRAIQFIITSGACLYYAINEKMSCVAWGVAAIIYFILLQKEIEKSKTK